jgi:mRNA interferase HicA
MKRRDLIRHVERQGCRLKRQGGRHTIFANPATGARAPMPRHREVNELTVISVCKQLGIPRP